MTWGMIMTGAATFASCLVLHILWWRLRRPDNYVLALALLFLVLPASALLGMPWLLPLFGRPAPGFADALAVTILHEALASAYVVAYPAFQAVSPTLQILSLFQREEGLRLTRGEIMASLDPGGLMADRVEDLEASRWVVREKGRLCLAPFGRSVVAFYRIYRRLLGLPLKGG